MLDAVIDLSHYQSPNDFGAAKAAGLLGVICKATQGAGYTDPKLDEHREAARAAGLLTGCYHFGTGEASGATQARYFLSQLTSGDLMALDFERDPSGATMTLAQAADFVETVKSATGAYPVLYGGSSLKAPGIVIPDPLLACPLWLAEYGPHAVLPRGWSEWSLWQYSDGTINAPADEWPGIGRCDRDRWCGTADDLPAFWSGHAATP